MIRYSFPPQLANWYNYGAGGYQTIKAPPNASQGKGGFKNTCIGTKIFSTLNPLCRENLHSEPRFPAKRLQGKPRNHYIPMIWKIKHGYIISYVKNNKVRGPPNWPILKGNQTHVPRTCIQ
ncbi:hypothetical protein I7I53_05900 [Histoplasma capsulatum var. duboisii H88]|uniref:Uncharacterized protein n=1 Tax=Ajellomyces capsulatus (strain H88) TaxID=544711 RepID=A0A8A1LD42_AJEC8|nr:hypothetical protein I7I53_05900 [Histoplasma capsulatum var. duboisii H88]